jgi:hypothetical protein
VVAELQCAWRLDSSSQKLGCERFDGGTCERDSPALSRLTIETVSRVISVVSMGQAKPAHSNESETTLANIDRKLRQGAQNQKSFFNRPCLGDRHSRSTSGNGRLNDLGCPSQPQDDRSCGEWAVGNRRDDFNVARQERNRCGDERCSCRDVSG